MLEITHGGIFVCVQESQRVAGEAVSQAQALQVRCFLCLILSVSVCFCLFSTRTVMRILHPPITFLVVCSHLTFLSYPYSFNKGLYRALQRGGSATGPDTYLPFRGFE